MAMDEKSEQMASEPELEKLGHLVRYLSGFIRNPIVSIQKVPDWDWQALVVFYIIMAAGCGALRGLLSGHITQFISGLIVAPIMSVISATLVTGMVYYVLVFFFDREPLIRRIFTLVLLAAVPAMALSIVSHWLPVITLAGLFLSGLLLVEGVAGNFNVDRKRFGKMVAAIYLVYLLFWLYSSWHFQHEKDKYKSNLTTPASLQVLKQELEH